MGLRCLALRRRVGLSDRFVFVARLQDKLDDVGPVIFGAELRGGEEVGLLRPAAVDVPTDQILAAGRGHVIAGRRPGDPFAALRLDEEGEQFRASLQRSQRILPSP